MFHPTYGKEGDINLMPLEMAIMGHYRDKLAVGAILAIKIKQVHISTT